MKLRLLSGAALMAASIMVAGAASATPVSVTFNGQAGAKSGTVFNSIQNGAGGPFNIDVAVGGNPTSSFIAWCIELTEFVSSGDYVQTTDNSLTSAAAPEISDSEENLLSRLFTLAYDTVAEVGNTFGNRTNNTAFQMAIWEIIYEAEANPLNVREGDFVVTNHTTARGIAQGWLDGLKSVTANYSFTYYLSTATNTTIGRQDLLVGAPISPVPLPAGIVLLLGGVGALAAVKRRQRRA